MKEAGACWALLNRKEAMVALRGEQASLRLSLEEAGAGLSLLTGGMQESR